MLLRPQPIWVQMPISLATSALSLCLSLALTTVLLGSVDRIADGIVATAGGAREDLKRAYLPLLGMSILQAILFILGFIPIGLVMLIVIILASIAEAWWLFALVGLPLFFPLIYVSMRLALASAAVVLGRLGPWTAIKTSWSRARGHLLKILGVFLPMLPFMIPIIAASAISSMQARSAMDPQDLSAAVAYAPPPIVDILSLVSAPFIAVVGLWIGAALALLWRHLDDSVPVPATSTPVLDA
jgi:hypothetical protein